MISDSPRNLGHLLLRVRQRRLILCLEPFKILPCGFDEFLVILEIQVDLRSVLLRKPGGLLLEHRLVLSLHLLQKILPVERILLQELRELLHQSHCLGIVRGSYRKKSPQPFQPFISFILRLRQREIRFYRHHQAFPDGIRCVRSEVFPEPVRVHGICGEEAACDAADSLDIILVLHLLFVSMDTLGLLEGYLPCASDLSHALNIAELGQAGYRQVD